MSSSLDPKKQNPMETVWHLTPNGWQRGTIVGAPVDRLLTMHCLETESSIQCREVWTAKDRARIKPFLDQFGAGPMK